MKNKKPIYIPKWMGFHHCILHNYRFYPHLKPYVRSSISWGFVFPFITIFFKTATVAVVPPVVEYVVTVYIRIQNKTTVIITVVVRIYKR